MNDEKTKQAFCVLRPNRVDVLEDILFPMDDDKNAELLASGDDKRVVGFYHDFNQAHQIAVELLKKSVMYELGHGENKKTGTKSGKKD
jgi:hypothetical protein